MNNVVTDQQPTRLVNAYHELSFTGSALNNGGTVVIREVATNSTGDNLRLSVAGQNVYEYSQVNYLALGDLAPSTIIGPARETKHILMVPRDTAYDDCGRVVAHLTPNA